jgi:Xaa-Pro aminopeptidase
MESHFTSKFFTGNRERLRESYEGELVVVTANGLLQRGADSAYGFAQDANFWYLTGLDEPDVILVLADSEEYLILPEQSDYQKIFDGSAPESELTKRSGVKAVFGYDEGWARLAAAMKKARRLGTVMPPPAYVGLYGMYTNPARRGLVEKLKDRQTGLKIDDITPKLALQRMIKQPEEISAIRAAIDVTVASLKDAFKQKYSHEYELEAEITAGFRRRGAAGHAFEPIVAAGRRACTLHNVANDAPIGQSEAVVVDVGAEVEHYAADITRTVVFGRPSARQRAVYEAVLAVQDFAIGLLKPGMSLKLTAIKPIA